MPTWKLPLAACLIVISACTSVPPVPSGEASSGSGSATPAASAPGGGEGGSAAGLRVDLNRLLAQHVVLLAKATGAVPDGRTEQLEAYRGALEANDADIRTLIASAAGPEAGDEWNGIWSTQAGFFVELASALAADDQAGHDRALENLSTVYIPDLSAFLAGVTGISEADVSTLVTEQVLRTEAVINAQAAADWQAAYEAVRAAYAHMRTLGDAVAAGLAERNAMTGEADTAAVDFHTALTQLLQEHVLLVTLATDAAIGGRDQELAAATATLTEIERDLGDLMASVAGAEAGDAWNRTWGVQTGSFVEYASAVAAGDQAMQDQAVQKLTTEYIPDFSAQLAGLTGLPEQTVFTLVTEQVLRTEAVINAQAAGDAAAAAQADRQAATHMGTVADAVAGAMVTAHPESFE